MIYLDHHAAAPVPPGVQEAMSEASSIAWANPSSVHQAGRASHRLLETARDQIAAAIGATPADLVITGGGTEACNLGIRGLAEGRTRVVTTEVEHPAVAQTVRQLERTGGLEAIRLSARDGQAPAPEELASHLGPSTLVAIQWVNHETGLRFPVEDYATACQEHGAGLFVDATQALGKVSIDVESLGADAVALAAHKVGGPAGSGACWIRRGVELSLVTGGGAQERGRRPGTPDVASAVGFGAAAALTAHRLERQEAIGALRNRIELQLVELGGVPNRSEPRVATVCNLSFRDWKGAVLVAALDVEGVCVSAGAACSSGLQAPSEILLATYPDAQWRAGSAVRISLGIETTDEDIDQALLAFRRVLARGPQ